MKTTIKYIPAFVISLLLLTGCNDFLTEKPQSKLTQDGFYSTQTRINEGVIGCYASLANASQKDWFFTELRSDNAWQSDMGTSNIDRTDQTDISVFRAYATLPEIQTYWAGVFQTISNINGVLPSVVDNKYVEYEPLRAQYEGELRFLRAYNYYNLVCLFGDMFKVTTVLSPAEAKTLERRPVDEIYDDLIIPDLKYAADNLPAQYAATDVGRATKWAAMGLLAKVYMMRGGSANIALAKPLLEQVMATPLLGLLTGTNAYATIFSTTNEMNKEIIFAIRYKGGSSGLGSTFWPSFAPSGSANLFLKIGSPLGYNSPTNELMSLFNAQPQDKRASACFAVWTGKTPNIPYVCKYVDANMTQANQAENDWIVLRYADIELLYAEALAQDGNFATANKYVNDIRSRAGVATLPAFTSATEALDAVYAERRLELAFENQRWFDLLRMAKSYNDPNKPVEVLKKHVFETDWAFIPPGGTSVNAGYGMYTVIPVADPSYFIKERLLLPIPQYEININPNIKQNYPY